MAVRAWLGMLLGTLLVGGAVTFFVVIFQRDGDLLDNGVRVTATVALGGFTGLVAVFFGGRGVVHARDARRYPEFEWALRGSPFPPIEDSGRPVLRGVDVPDIAPRVPASGGSAWDHPPTRSQWNGYLLRSALLAAVSLAVTITPVPLESLRIVAGSVAALSIYALCQAAWWRYLLASGPWQRWSAIQSESSHGSGGDPPILLLTAATPSHAQVEVTLKLGACNKRALRSFTITEGTVLFLPGRRRSGVLLLETGRRPFTIRLPVSERQWGRWRSVDFGMDEEMDEETDSGP